MNEVVLHQSDFDNPNELKNLTSETWSSALLDCASKTVCGKEWLNMLTILVVKINKKSLLGILITYIDLGMVKRSNLYILLKSLASLADVVDSDIPLLFSKSSMKRANMKLNFQDDTITIFNENIPFITTQSGHYAIPITKAKQLINNLDRETNMSITLTLSDSKDNHTIALNLHRQFAHANKEKLLQLINKAGEP